MSVQPQDAPTQVRTRDDSGIQGVWRSAARFRWVLAGVVAALIAALWFAWFDASARERAQTLTATGRSQRNLSIAVGHYLARAFSNADGLGRFLTSTYARKPAGFTEVLAERARANELFRELVMCEVDGRVLTSSSVQEPQRADWCAQWLAFAPPDARSYPMMPVYWRDEVLIPLVSRVPGDPGAMLAILVEVRRLLGVMEDYRIPEETAVLVAGADGFARARWHSVAGMSDQRAPEVAHLAEILHTGGPAQRHMVDGRPMRMSAGKVPGYPAIIVVGTVERDVFAESRTRAIYTALACAVATLVLLALSWFLLRLQRRTLQLAAAIEDANAGLTEQVRARTAALEEAYSELETFSYAVAHDVRAPIAAISGFAQALKPALQQTADQKALHYVGRIAANAARMTELTEALLSLGRLSRTPVSRTLVDLSGMSHAVMAGLREQGAGARQIEVHIQDGLLVVGDPVLLRQVMENLLGNSCKFTQRREVARISVTGTPEAGTGRLVVCVQDNGEGFEMKDDRKDFVPFQRRHSAHDFPGTGVGLATVDRIVRLHGGRVWIASSPGAGTVVSFTIEAAPEA